MKIYFFILVAVFSILFCSPIYADELCPDVNTQPPPSGADELKMFEHQFSFEHAISSFHYLENDVYDILRRNEKTEDVLNSVNFYISYPNSIKFIKGTVLRQNAQLAKERLEIARLEVANGTGTEEEKEKAEKEFIQAQEEFCKFLGSAEYVD